MEQIPMEQNLQDQDPQEKVPLFKKWSYWYWLVAGFLCVCIAAFYLLTKHFS